MARVVGLTHVRYRLRRSESQGRGCRVFARPSQQLSPNTDASAKGPVKSRGVKLRVDAVLIHSESLFQRAEESGGRKSSLMPSD
jgi:hypothetical protein